MVVSSIRVAIYRNPGYNPFPESCDLPIILEYFNDLEAFIHAKSDLYIDCNFIFDSTHIASLTKLLPALVLVDAVALAGTDLPAGFVRFNGWPAFGAGNLLELAGIADDVPELILQFAMACGLSCTVVPDKVGMVRPRIVAMIINEAYLALGEGVSSLDAIDTAMKLGTGYPFGPFEWAGKIGIGRVYGLLKRMSAIDIKYLPAPLLVEAAQQQPVWQGF